MSMSHIRITLIVFALSLFTCGCSTNDGQVSHSTSDQTQQENTMVVQYLEIVTPEVDKTCEVLAKQHGVSFGDPEAMLGGARVASLENGGRMGVRAPMAEHEEPVVRPYVLTKDIDSAVSVAEEVGAEIALPPTEIPGQGKFAIYILGGIQHGLWQL